MAFKKGHKLAVGRPKGCFTIAEKARAHADEAIANLVDVMRNGSDAARVSASNAILDRGFGKALTTNVNLNDANVEELTDNDLIKAIRERASKGTGTPLSH